MQGWFQKMSNKHIDLFKEIIPSVDLNLRDLWDAVDDDARKEIKNDMWNLNRYISSVQSSDRDITEHFVLTVNEYYNKNWFLLQKNHSKLLWLLLCMCNYNGKTKFFHEWIPLKKSPVDKKLTLLAEFYPNKKMDELELLAAISTDKEVKDLARKHGWDEATIAKRLK